MESIGVVLVLGGVLALLVTGLGFARKQQALVDRLKSGYSDQWVRLGKPEASSFKPFNSTPLTELVSYKGSSVQETPELAALHLEARRWFYAFGIHFGTVFLGCLILGASN